MRKNYILVLFAALSLSLTSTSCGSDNSSASQSASMGTTTGNYWPLAVGNQWNFQENGSDSNPMEITGTDVFTGVTYYKMSNYSQQYQMSVQTWTAKKGASYFQKINEINMVESGVSVNMSGYEMILLKDDLNVNQTWTGSYSQNVTTVYNGQTQKSTMATTYVGTILERDATVTLNDKTYTNVIKFSMVQKSKFNGQDIEVDTEYWYAKDVGPLKSVAISAGISDTSVLKDYVLK